MKYLLDVNVLLGAVWTNQASHPKVVAWLKGKELALCPLSELGFLRISSNPKVFGYSMDDARRGLEALIHERKSAWIEADLPALDSRPKTSAQVTDHYLADLAAKHGFRLATLDLNLRHPAAEYIG